MSVIHSLLSLIDDTLTSLGLKSGQNHSDVPRDHERKPIGRDHRDQAFVVQKDDNAWSSTQYAARTDGLTSISLPTSSSEEGSHTLVKFHSLVDRSIAAWRSIDYVGPERDNEEKKNATIDREIQSLKRHTCLDDVLESKGYWFFQLRESFMQQNSTFMKWDPTQLDEYILLPVSYGFVNNRECFFVSHYWHTKEHPDPEGVDLVQVQQDLRDLEWSYVWVDWTCVPQLPRTEVEQRYFDRSLHFIHMLVRDCAFEWRFPAAFEPRGWILYEVAEFVLSHKYFAWTDDIRPFIEHLAEMSAEGVKPVVRRYGYRCSRQGDLNLVIGWLELAILLAKILPEGDDVGVRQQIWDDLDRPYVGTLVVTSIGMEIDKVKGIVKYQGRTYNFTSTWRVDK